MKKGESLQAYRKWGLSIALILALVVGLVAPAVVVAEPEVVKVLITFDRQPGVNEEEIVRSAGGAIKYTYHLVPAIAASFPEVAIQGLSRNPRVVSIEPDIKVYAIDAELDNTWGVKHIGAGVVHNGGNRGTGVKVAVIDSGIDYTHPDLDANYAGGYDFVNGDSDPMDDNGHGTHVAGTIAAEDDGVGVVGVAPEAQIYALKVLGADGTGSESDVLAALEWAVDNGIQVTNNSYGSSEDLGLTLQAAFDNAYDAGVIHIAAAGNSGNASGEGDSVEYPARWESVIAVVAIDQTDNRASWSSTGPGVELAAPGVGIESTYWPWPFDYWSLDGTSMASPHVAGMAALIIASGITDANDDGRINDEVRQRLAETADDLGDPGRDTKYGYGLVDADEAAHASAYTITSSVDFGIVALDSTKIMPAVLTAVVDLTVGVAVADTSGSYVADRLVKLEYQKAGVTQIAITAPTVDDVGSYTSTGSLGSMSENDIWDMKVTTGSTLGAWETVVITLTITFK